MAQRSPYPVQRPPQGGLSKFRNTVQQSDDAPELVDIDGVGAPGTNIEVSRADHSHVIVPASSGMFGLCVSAIQVTTQANPTAKPWCFAQKVYVPFPTEMHGYAYWLLSAGLREHGALLLSVWTHNVADNRPDTEYTAARVVCFHQSKAAGMVAWPLQSLGVSLLTLSAGLHWIVGTIDANAGLGIITPPLSWLDAGAAGDGSIYGIEIDGLAGFVAGPWDSGAAVPQQYAPHICLI